MVETADGEPVARLQGIDDAGGGPTGGHDLPAAHAPGTVQQHDHVLRTGGDSGLWRKYREPEELAVLGAVGDLEGRRDRVRLGEGEAEYEVTVDPFARVDPQACDLVGRLLLDDGVQARPDVAQGETGGVEIDGDRQVHGVREARQKDRRPDPRGVGNRVRVRHDAVSDGLSRERFARDEARRHHQRQPQSGLSVLIAQRADGRQRDDRFLAWSDVADPHREHVGPLGLRDRGALTRRDGLVVDGAGLTPLAKLSGDDTSGHGHRHVGQRRALGQREDVRGLDGLRVWIVESLPQGRLRRQARDVDGDVEPAQWEIAPLGRQCSQAALSLWRVERLWQGGNAHGHERAPSSVRPRASAARSKGCAARRSAATSA
ncbi:hypothetical protein STSO111631_18225 [Stackebrandtia soli]